MQENSHIFNHWKCGGKMKWFAQVRLDAGGGYSQIQKAVDEGAAGIHINWRRRRVPAQRRASLRRSARPSS